MATWNKEEEKRIKELLSNYEIDQAKVAWYKKVIVPKVLAAKEIYLDVARALNIPLGFIPSIHVRENGSDVGVFKAYLGNGEPLNRVTTIVPRGRGPFKSWAQGAIDALKLDGMDKIKDWSLERMVFEWEKFNGFGYRSHGILSPYVWAGTNLYSKGKYVSDGRFSATAIDEQVGTLALYDLLCEADSDFKFRSEDTVDEKPPVKVANQRTCWDKVKSTFAEILNTEVPRVVTPEVVDAISPFELIKQKRPSISPKTLQCGLDAMKTYANKIKNKNWLTVVDMDLSSGRKRLWVINMKTFESSAYFTTHGSGSDPDNDGIATLFSNTPGSNMSSLGAMLTGDTYTWGKHPFAMKLYGLEDRNSNVEKRAIVMHDASYADDSWVEKYGHLGRSQGCLALDSDYAGDIMNRIKGGSLVYVSFRGK